MKAAQLRQRLRGVAVRGVLAQELRTEKANVSRHAGDTREKAKELEALRLAHAKVTERHAEAAARYDEHKKRFDTTPC